MRFADLDAVTVDGFGTVVTLADPVPALRDALRELGIDRSSARVASAFAAEGAHYRARSHLGSDQTSLARLRRECVGVFLAELGASLKAEAFVEPFLGALRFEPVPGAVETIEHLRERRLRLALVANWDRSLHERLDELGLASFFDAVITSAEAGAPKPDPRIFELALDRLGARPDRTLHVGDEPVDEEGARAARLHFAPAPLATAFARWT
jgi:putative hydrolase of the HAD superfamily